MNSEQTQGLYKIRNRFVSERQLLSNIDDNELLGRLEVLPLPDLRYLADFSAAMRSALVDLELTDEQMRSEESPVKALSDASRKAIVAIHELESRYWERMKEFDGEMRSGFRLESVIAEPKYKTIARLNGLNLETVTIRFLQTFDARKSAQVAKSDLVKQFGYRALASMYQPGGPAIKLSRLIEDGFKQTKFGPNPVLFDAIATEIIDTFTKETYGEVGYVKRGVVNFKFSNPGESANLNLAYDEMRIIEVGLDPKKFKLSADTQEYFPSLPGKLYKPTDFEPATIAKSVIREMKDEKTGLTFLVQADVYITRARYDGKFGHVSTKG